MILNSATLDRFGWLAVRILYVQSTSGVEHTADIPCSAIIDDVFKHKMPQSVHGIIPCIHSPGNFIPVRGTVTIPPNGLGNKKTRPDHMEVPIHMILIVHDSVPESRYTVHSAGRESHPLGFASNHKLTNLFVPIFAPETMFGWGIHHQVLHS